MQQGIPNFEGAKRAIKFVKKNGLDDAARALEYVVVGAFRPHETEGTWGVCARCAEVVLRGQRHDYYECADNDQISYRIFKKASKRLKFERTDIPEQQCLWI